MADQQDLARELLTRAQDDERAAQALLPAGDVSDTIVGFHAQQAVEKESAQGRPRIRWRRVSVHP